MQGINGTSCAIFKVYNTVINGEGNEKPLPKWDGIIGIKNALSETKTAIYSIGNLSDQLLNSQNQTKSKMDTTYNQFPTYSINETIKNQHKIKSPLSTNNQILPTFYDNFSPIEIPGKTLFNIQTEYQLVFNNSYNAMKKVSDSSTSIKGSINLIESTLTSSITSISDIDSTFNDFSNDILNDWLKYQDYINDYANIVFYALTGVLMLFGVIGFICVFFYTITNKCNCLRIILHILWNFLALFTFILMLLGSIFGLLGIIGTDGVGVISYIFGEDNLIKSDKPIVLTGDTGNYINTCVNGNGDLADQLKLRQNNTGIDSIEKIYQMDSNITELNENISKVTELQTITTFGMEITKQEQDISFSHEDINSALNKINVNSNVQGKKDRWETNATKCGDVYQDIKETIVEKEYYCFSLMDLDNIDRITARYGSVDSDLTNIFRNFITYIDKNKNILTKLKRDNEDMSDLITTILAGFKSDLSISQKITKSVADIYSSMIGDAEIYSLVNCSKFHIFNSF